MKTVPLYGGKAAGRVALVDDGDYDLVMQYHWNVKERKRPRRTDGPYVMTGIRRNGKQVTVYMHTLLTGWPMVDHQDHDGLNNQRYNLRPATTVQNGANRRPNLGHSSRFKGVGWYKPLGRWRANIRHDGRLRHLGYFTSEEEAAKVYDAAARKVFGEYAQLNFPDAA